MRWLRTIRNKWRALFESTRGTPLRHAREGAWITTLGVGAVVFGLTAPREWVALGDGSGSMLWLITVMVTLVWGPGLLLSSVATAVKQSRALKGAGTVSLDFGPVQVLLSSLPVDGLLVSEFTVDGLWQGLHIESRESPDGRRFPSDDTGQTQPPVARQTVAQCGPLDAESVALLDPETVKHLQELAALGTLRIQDGTLRLTFDHQLSHVSDARSLAERLSHIAQRVAAPPQDVPGRLLELTKEPSRALPVEREIANTAARQLVMHYPDEARVLEWAESLARTPADIDPSLAVELWCLLRKTRTAATDLPLLTDHFAHADGEAMQRLITQLFSESGPEVDALLVAVLEHASAHLSPGQFQSARERLAAGSGRLSLSMSRGGALSEAHQGALSPASDADFEGPVTE